MNGYDDNKNIKEAWFKKMRNVSSIYIFFKFPWMNQINSQQMNEIEGEGQLSGGKWASAIWKWRGK